MKLVFLGPPGAGKGTQAISVCRKYELVHIAMGDILRDEASSKTKMGIAVKLLIDKGHLVPDDLTLEIVEKKIKGLSGKDFVLDGFPRDLVQARMFEDVCSVDAVFEIYCPDEVIVDRLSKRRVCKCGETYNLLFNPPLKKEVCDVCGEKLYKRDDDNPSAIKRRLNIYHKMTEPLIGYYKDKYVRIDGNQGIEKVFGLIVEEISKRF